MTFAQHTTVPVEQTKTEIDRLLEKHGATNRGTMQNDEKRIAIVVFTLKGAQYRIDVPLSSRTPKTDRWQQTERTRWRLVLLAIKTKLELVALGVSTVEHEFLADMVLPNGRTVQEDIGEMIRRGMGSSGPRQLGGGP